MVSTLDKVTLATLGAVLAYAVFQWGGVVRSDQYAYLLALGLLAIALSLGRSRHRWAPLPSRVVRWAAVLMVAYVLLQVIPLPLAVLRLLSPERAAAVDALAPIGATVSFASLSVSPACNLPALSAAVRLPHRLPPHARVDLAFRGSPLAGDCAHRRHRSTGSGPGTVPKLRRRRGPNSLGNVRQP